MAREQVVGRFHPSEKGRTSNVNHVSRMVKGKKKGKVVLYVPRGEEIVAHMHPSIFTQLFGVLRFLEQLFNPISCPLNGTS